MLPWIVHLCSEVPVRCRIVAAMRLSENVGEASGNALVDLGKSCYTTRRIDIADADFSLGNLYIPVSNFSGNAIADMGNSLIASDELVIKAPELLTDANFHNFRLDLENMRLSTLANGSIAGADFTLDADYGIDDEAFSADLVLNKTDLAKLLQMPDDELVVNNEFIPSIRYSFNYNNYFDRARDINTALDIQLKESGNLLSGILAASGRDFNERFKRFLGIEYDQFVKFKLELRNKFKLDDKLELATRAILGAVISYGNSVASPLSESFPIGGPDSIRAFSPRSIGPGDFHNQNFSSYIFHTGDLKLEMNAELRFPIIWKFNGALFVDAGNVWNQRDPRDYLSAEQIEAYLKGFNLPHMYNSHIQADTFLSQIALGSGMGLRLDYESIVIRLDLGVAIHAPFNTGRQGYYNIPNFRRDGLRLNFGIGYPF